MRSQGNSSSHAGTNVVRTAKLLFSQFCSQRLPRLHRGPHKLVQRRARQMAFKSARQSTSTKTTPSRAALSSEIPEPDTATLSRPGILKKSSTLASLASPQSETPSLTTGIPSRTAGTALSPASVTFWQLSSFKEVKGIGLAQPYISRIAAKEELLSSPDILSHLSVGIRARFHHHYLQEIIPFAASCRIPE